MKKDKNLNYDFQDQVEPKKRMGANDFANLPSRPIFEDFDGPSYRGGNINSFSSSVSKLSGISENGSLDGYDKEER